MAKKKKKKEKKEKKMMMRVKLKWSNLIEAMRLTESQDDHEFEFAPQQRQQPTVAPELTIVSSRVFVFVCCFLARMSYRALV